MLFLGDETYWRQFIYVPDRRRQKLLIKPHESISSNRLMEDSEMKCELEPEGSVDMVRHYPCPMLKKEINHFLHLANLASHCA